MTDDARLLVQRDPDVSAAANRLHDHLYASNGGCCAARHGRYCSEGLALKSAYDAVHRERSGPESKQYRRR